MSQARPFRPDSFEQLAVNGELVLLRVAGAASPAGAAVAALLVDDGGERHRIAPLPGLGGDGARLRAGFSLAARLVEGSTFALELDDGAIVELPAPVQRTGTDTAIERLTRALAAAEARARTSEEAAQSALDALRAAELRVAAERDRVEALESRLAEAKSAIGALAEQAERSRRAARPPRADAAAERESTLELALNAAREHIAHLEAELGRTGEPSTGPQPTPVMVLHGPARPLANDGEHELARRRSGAGVAAAGPADSPDAESNPGQALDVARAIAINMALAGRPREEAERLLRDDLGLSDPQTVLDECYGPARWPTPSRGRLPSLRRRPRH